MEGAEKVGLVGGVAEGGGCHVAGVGWGDVEGGKEEVESAEGGDGAGFGSGGDGWRGGRGEMDVGGEA